MSGDTPASTTGRYSSINRKFTGSMSPATGHSQARSNNTRNRVLTSKISAPRPINLPSLRRENAASSEWSQSSNSCSTTSVNGGVSASGWGSPSPVSSPYSSPQKLDHADNAAKPVEWQQQQQQNEHPQQQPSPVLSKTSSSQEASPSSPQQPRAWGSPAISTTTTTTTTANITSSTTSADFPTAAETMSSPPPTQVDQSKKSDKKESLSSVLSDPEHLDWDELVRQDLEEHHDEEKPEESSPSPSQVENETTVLPSDRFTQDYDRSYPPHILQVTEDQERHYKGYRENPSRRDAYSWREGGGGGTTGNNVRNHRDRRPSGDRLWGRSSSRDRQSDRGRSQHRYERRPSYDRRSGGGSSVNFHPTIMQRPRRMSEHSARSDRSSSRDDHSTHEPVPSLDSLPETSSTSPTIPRPKELTAAQREYMHTAAERAKKRRDEEEAEREAARERARKKAEALAAAMQNKESFEKTTTSSDDKTADSNGDDQQQQQQTVKEDKKDEEIKSDESTLNETSAVDDKSETTKDVKDEEKEDTKSSKSDQRKIEDKFQKLKDNRKKSKKKDKDDKSEDTASKPDDTRSLNNDRQKRKTKKHKDNKESKKENLDKVDSDEEEVVQWNEYVERVRGNKDTESFTPTSGASAWSAYADRLQAKDEQRWNQQVEQYAAERNLDPSMFKDLRQFDRHGRRDRPPATSDKLMDDNDNASVTDKRKKDRKDRKDKKSRHNDRRQSKDEQSKLDNEEQWPSLGNDIKADDTTKEAETASTSTTKSKNKRDNRRKVKDTTRKDVDKSTDADAKKKDEQTSTTDDISQDNIDNKAASLTSETASSPREKEPADTATRIPDQSSSEHITVTTEDVQEDWNRAQRRQFLINSGHPIFPTRVEDVATLKPPYLSFMTIMDGVDPNMLMDLNEQTRHLLIKSPHDVPDAAVDGVMFTDQDRQVGHQMQMPLATTLPSGASNYPPFYVYSTMPPFANGTYMHNPMYAPRPDGQQVAAFASPTTQQQQQQPMLYYMQHPAQHVFPQWQGMPHVQQQQTPQQYSNQRRHR